MPLINPHRRLASDNFDIVVGGHALTLTVARDKDDVPREIAFIGRGKPGQQLDQMLVDLGIAVSRAIQRRSPETGAPLDPGINVVPIPAHTLTPSDPHGVNPYPEER